MTRPGIRQGSGRSLRSSAARDRYVAPACGGGGAGAGGGTRTISISAGGSGRGRDWLRRRGGALGRCRLARRRRMRNELALDDRAGAAAAPSGRRRLGRRHPRRLGVGRVPAGRGRVADGASQRPGRLGVRLGRYQPGYRRLAPRRSPAKPTTADARTGGCRRRGRRGDGGRRSARRPWPCGGAPCLGFGRAIRPAQPRQRARNRARPGHRQQRLGDRRIVGTLARGATVGAKLGARRAASSADLATHRLP